MVNKFAVSIAALLALAGTAYGADLPSRVAPPVYVPPPIPVFTWTGFYIGGQAGYEFGKDYNSAAGFAAPAKGVIGGAHIGYNYQFPASNFVVGLEGDVEGTSAKAYTFAGASALDFYKEQIEGSIRGRLGYAVDRALFYATGGVAFGGLNNTYYSGAFTPVSYSHTRAGYTVGGGVEYAISNNWSLRAEYRYTDFGHYTDIGASGVTITKHDTDNKVEAGFSYKFDTATPVVARY